MFSVIINAKFAIVASLLCQYFPISVVLLYSKKLIQKRLNISIQQSKMVILWTVIAQIFPKMHGLAYEISKLFRW